MGTTSKLLEGVIVAGSGLAVGVFLVLAGSSLYHAGKSRGKEIVGHVGLAVARVSGAVTVGLVAEALYRAPGGTQVSGRAYAYAAAIAGIALGYLVALLTRVVPK